MAFENVEIGQGNFTLDFTGANFYTFDHLLDRLIQKNSSGDVIFTYVLETPIIEVNSVEFDGYYYWTLERQGSSGFRVRRWEIGSDSIVRIDREFSYNSDAINNYDVYNFAVEWYSDSVDTTSPADSSVIQVNDGSVIQPGDEIIIGPSTAVGFEGEITKTVVTSKPASNQIEINPPAGPAFSSNDPIYFSRSFFVFSDEGPAGLSGALYKYDSFDGATLLLDVSNIYSGVRAATFFQNYVIFIRAGEIIWINPSNLDIFKSQAIDNLNLERSEYIETFDLTGFSNTIYRLEQRRVYYDNVDEEYKQEVWSPNFNYNTSSSVPEVYFVALKADPHILHKNAAGVAAQDKISQIYVQVLDQFRTPVSGRIVNFTASDGTLSSSQETTDVNGEARLEYTSSNTAGDITIRAEVV